MANLAQQQQQQQQSHKRASSVSSMNDLYGSSNGPSSMGRSGQRKEQVRSIGQGVDGVRMLFSPLDNDLLADLEYVF